MRALWIVLLALTACWEVDKPEVPDQPRSEPLTATEQALLDSVVNNVGAYRDSIYKRYYPDPVKIPPGTSDPEVLRAIVGLEQAQRLSDIRQIRLLCWSSLNCDIDCPYRRTRCRQRSSD